MKFKKIRNSRVKINALLLTILILVTNFISVNYAIPKLSDEPVPNYLYEFPVTKESYKFKAKGECYVIANVKNTDFSSFVIDDEQFYEVSYGFNAIPITFSESLEIHNITLENHAHFQSLTIEPLFLAEGDVDVNLDEGVYENITFDAGGLISILLKPNFSYNLLHVRLDDCVLKSMYDTTTYPKIDSQLYSYFAHGGAYLRFDIEVLPDTHYLLLKGNGNVEYIIMVNDDWDDDALPDVTEIQKQAFYALDPTVPDIWGFFEKSDKEVLLNMSATDKAREGYFSYYIPEPGSYFLRIEVEEGEFFDIEFDGDSMSLKNMNLTGNTGDDTAIVMVYDSGWHHVKYKYLSNYNEINFNIAPTGAPYQTIKVIEQPELIDSDGDGVKDFEEKNNNLKRQGTDSDGDGLPDNYDTSPFASLTLNKNRINRFIIPTDHEKNSIVTIQIKAPNKDYSTNGIPRLWRGTLNVSIYPALRLFGNEYQLWEDSSVLPLYRSTTTSLWNKAFNTYNLVSGYDTSVNAIGDAFPKITEPNGETHFLFPNIAEETWEFEFSFLKNNPAKSDQILDLRFDFIWFLTQYDSDTKETKILHYYNFEEHITLQSMSLKEIGNINYLLATPDNFVESQILWNLLQNPTIGTREDFGVDDDVIASGTVDYSNIANRINYHIRQYYQANPERNTEAEVSYFSGSHQTYDILDKYKSSLVYGLDSIKVERRDFQSQFSYYSINNVYEDKEYFIGDSEITGEYKINYVIAQNLYNENQQVATISEMPLAMEKKNFPDSDSNVLEIIQAISEPIPLNEIPNEITPSMHPKIKLKKVTYIEKKILNEQIPTVNFDIDTDFEKTHYYNRAPELDQGELFFEGDTTTPAEAELFTNLINSFQNELKDIHELYSYFNTEEGQDICSAEIFDPYREFDYFLNNYIDENGQFLTGFLDQDINSKLQELNTLDLEISDMVGQQRDLFINIRADAVPEPFFEPITNLMGTLTKKADATGVSIKASKIGVSAGKQFGSYATKGKYLGKYKGKLQYLGDKIETSTTINGALALYQIATSGWSLIAGVNGLMKDWLEGPGSDDPYNVSMWIAEMAFGACNVLMSAFTLVSGVIQFLECVRVIASNTLKNAKNFLTKASWVIAFIIIIFDWSTFLIKLFSGEYSGNEIAYQFTKLVIETAAVVIGLAVAASVSTTGVGIVVGAVIALFTLLGGWLTQLLNSPSIDIQDCSLNFDYATKLSLRRQGSLEVGNHINYNLKIKNDGDRPGWIRARYRLRQQKSGGWVTSWDGWDSHGNWYAEWHAPPFDEGETFETTFSKTIPYPTTDLHYSFELQFDWQRFELIIIVPTWWRTEGARESFTEPIGMPVLENNIADFYEDTTELMSTSLLKQVFDSATEEYRWKDAYDAATEIMSRTESKAKTPTSDFEYFYTHPTLQSYGNYYQLKTENFVRFGYAICSYYAVGFRAKNPIPDADWWPFRFLGEFLRHVLSYSSTNGYILIPKSWMDNTLAELGDYYLYRQKRLGLPLRTNIRTDLRDNPIDIDPETKMANVNFQLYLEGPNNPNVNFVITPPENFSITPTVFTQRLRNDISITITQDNPSQIMGLYYFEMTILYSNQIIYSTLVPIRIKGISQIDYVAHVPPGPIDPGDTFNLLDVVNLGTVPDSVMVIIEGVPENYIYKDLYPDEFFDNVKYNNEYFDNVQFFNTMPGSSRETFVINPPRHYSTAPGIYDFTVTAIDPSDNSTRFIYQGSFEIVVYHEISFECSNPEVLIYDYENATYNFEVTNLGNMDENLTVIYDNLDFATSEISTDNFLLAPGETQSFNIKMDPFKLSFGPQEFRVEVSNEFISSEIICSLEVIDDDTVDPYFENIYVTDDCNWLNISFYGLDELLGDDMGLSLIEIFVDDELIHSYFPSPTDTIFDFGFVNKWIWEMTEEYYSDGQITHEIYVHITDADDDRVGDELTAEFIRYFEVTLDEMYDYVIWLLGEVNEYIYDNGLVALYGTVTQKLVKVQDLLAEAYQLIEAGELHTGLVRDKMAEAKLEIAEAKAELKSLKDQVGEPYISEILSMMHDIRNKIVELMGRSVGTEFAHKISLSEVDLYNLRDLIEENVNETDRESLFNIIALAAAKLENAIFDISLGKDTENSLIQAVHALDHAKAEVKSLARKGKISESLKLTLLGQIMLLQAQIYVLIYEI